MSRLQKLFQKKNSHVLNIYCTAGYPALDSTMDVLKALKENGADIIELGMPYSDPLADGPVIQQSSAVALANGMTISLLLAQLKNMRQTSHIGNDLPVILMGYMNPVLQYGFEKFCKDAVAAGIDGLIIPDLPEFEFENMYGPIIKNSGLDFIFLVTPETSPLRIKKLDGLSSGFLYAVSSSSTTGSPSNSTGIENYLQRLRNMKLQNPVLVGFGIGDKKGFEEVCKLAEGAIIGSAYIRALCEEKPVEESTRKFLKTLLV